MSIRDARLEALRALLREHNDVRVDLAKKIRKAPSQISQWLSGHRTITEESAREIEQRCGKPRGWMDRGVGALGLPPPPSPGPRFADRHEVSESDFALLNDIKTAMESPRLAAQVEELRREAQAMEAFAAKHYGPKG